MDDYEDLKTDVLVIGGGATGLRAAIEADNQGVAVCLLSKGPVARSGVTPLVYQSVQGVFGTRNSRENPDIHYKDISA